MKEYDFILNIQIFIIYNQNFKLLLDIFIQNWVKALNYVIKILIYFLKDDLLSSGYIMQMLEFWTSNFVLKKDAICKFGRIRTFFVTI